MHVARPLVQMGSLNNRRRVAVHAPVPKRLVNRYSLLMPKHARNRWSRTLDRKESTLSAAAMFFFSIVGQLALIVSTFVIIGGLLMLFGSAEDGVGGRLVGLAMVAAAIAGYVGGAWAVNQFTVQRRI